MLIENVEWREFPEDLRTIVDPYLHRWWSLVPTWVQEFAMVFDSEDGSNYMSARLNYSNRRLILEFTAAWFNQSEEERNNTFLHELVHTLMEPVLGVTRRILVDLTDKGSSLRSFMHQTLDEGAEAAVEDTCRALGRLIAHE